MARLEELYKSTIIPGLQEKFQYKNSMQVPKLEKVIISMGVGRALQDKKIMENAERDLTIIAGQKPLRCKARMSVSNFKLREGYEIGLKVTLRKKRMFEFMDRLISLAIPRVRDFRGLNPDAFDGLGNYNMGVTEQLIFPEINPDTVTVPQGMNITMVTSAKNDDESRYMLKLFGMPFRDKK